MGPMCVPLTEEGGLALSGQRAVLQRAWARHLLHFVMGACSCRRYLELNWHAKSYTWKSLVRSEDTFQFLELDMNKVSRHARRPELCALSYGVVLTHSPLV